MYTITRRGAEIDASRTAAVARAKRELTVAPMTLNDPFPKKFKVYVEDRGKLVVPVHWALKALGPPAADERPSGDDVDLRFSGSLRADLRQPEATQAVLDSLRRTGGAMLCLAVGFGKTVSALYVASVLKRRTLVVVHKQFLADQWAERVAQCLPGARVTRVQGDTCDTSGDVVIAMLQTLVSRKYPASTFEGCGLLVADECHHVGAQVFSQAMFGLCLPYTLGLTATPDRKDGLARVVSWFLGDVAFRVQRENQASTSVRIVKYTSPRFDEPPPVNRRGDVCFTSVVSVLVEDEARTRLVAENVRALAEEGRNVLVLSHRRAHCEALARRLVAGGVDAATYLGGDKTVPESRVIVATYSLTSEGFDLPRLDALVLATPASDVVQSCGRVMRGHAKDSAIVDIVDQWGVCFAQAAKRRAFYRKSGFHVGAPAGPDTASTGPDTASPASTKSFAFLVDA